MTILDKDGNEAKVMPEWHKDVNPQALIQWCGHWFEFKAIDPSYDPNVVILMYKEPTKATKRRERCGKQNEKRR